MSYHSRDLALLHARGFGQHADRCVRVRRRGAAASGCAV